MVVVTWQIEQLMCLLVHIVAGGAFTTNTKDPWSTDNLPYKPAENYREL